MFTLNPTPSSNKAENLSEDQSSMKDSRFGGHREHGTTSSDKDYTARTGAASTIEENPVDDTARDIDDMANAASRKREFKYQEDKQDVQKNNETDFIKKTDKENQPLEETRAFEPGIDDPNFRIKKRGSKTPTQFGDGQYDNNQNRGNYEGEMR